MMAPSNKIAKKKRQDSRDDRVGGRQGHEFHSDIQHLLSTYWRQCDKRMLTESMHKTKIKDQDYFLIFTEAIRQDNRPITCNFKH